MRPSSRILLLAFMLLLQDGCSDTGTGMPLSDAGHAPVEHDADADEDAPSNETFLPQDIQALQGILDDAASGEVIQIGSVQLSGSLVVPPGVTLRGDGPENTILSAVDVAEAVRLSPGSTIENLAIVITNGVAIRAAGDAASSTVSISDVHVSLAQDADAASTEGALGIELQNLSHATISRVAIESDATDSELDRIPDESGPMSGARIAMLLSGVGTMETPAILEDLDIAQIGPWGVIVENGATQMTDVAVSDFVGTAIWIRGGSASLERSSVSAGRLGLQTKAMNGVTVTDAAEVHLVDGTAAHLDGVGLFASSETVVEVDGFQFMATRQGAVSAESCASISMSNTTMSTAVGASMVALGCTSVSLSDVNIMNQDRATLRGVTDLDDGIDLVSCESVTLTNVEVQADRVAILIQVSGIAVPASYSFSNVHAVGVDSGIGGFGLVAQTAEGVIPPDPGGWSMGVSSGGFSPSSPLSVPGALLESPGVFESPSWL